jgi:hypothetical protein
MQSALHTETTVLPGRRIEIQSPELPEGARVQVIILLPAAPAGRFGSAREFLESLPAGPRAFPTWDEYERHLDAERAAWDR